VVYPRTRIQRIQKLGSRRRQAEERLVAVMGIIII
jgi:hypothetical protein